MEDNHIAMDVFNTECVILTNLSIHVSIYHISSSSLFLKFKKIKRKLTFFSEIFKFSINYDILRRKTYYFFVTNRQVHCC